MVKLIIIFLIKADQLQKKTSKWQPSSEKEQDALVIAIFVLDIYFFVLFLLHLWKMS